MYSDKRRTLIYYDGEKKQQELASSNKNIHQVTKDMTVTIDDSTTNVEPPTLNYSSGTAAFCLDSIIIHQLRQHAKERIKEEITKGKSIKQTIQEAKRVVSGIVFKSLTTRLGRTVFDVAQNNINEKLQKQNEKTKKRVKREGTCQKEAYC